MKTIFKFFFGVGVGVSCFILWITAYSVKNPQKSLWPLTQGCPIPIGRSVPTSQGSRVLLFLWPCAEPCKCEHPHSAANSGLGWPGRNPLGISPHLWVHALTVLRLTPAKWALKPPSVLLNLPQLLETCASAVCLFLSYILNQGLTKCFYAATDKQYCSTE